MRADSARPARVRQRHADLSRTRGLRLRRPIVISSAIVILFIVAGTSGTQALLRASAPTSNQSVVISAGTADLSLSTLSLDTSSLYPGLTVVGTVTVSNTGSVPLSLGVSGLSMPSGSSANALSQSLIVGVRPVSSTSPCTAATASPTWTGSASSAPAGSIGSRLDTSSPTVLCVSVTLPLNAPAASQGQSATGIQLRISGTQV
ncbi:hypothetical protein [Agreia sp. COWG]|uniref:hypothetical protein n=1 Tax=Agreia sp. COWG TaxID=2773266 RepID=UPI00192846B8|nr:hypothetical protein [Agreia sp. COWG]CAD5994917.1 conserved protein of unknown function [Agreia sp. COWG]